MATEPRSRKLAPSLLALGSAAILAAYATGYIRTQPSEAAVAPSATAAARQSLASSPLVIPTAAATKSTASSPYRDGSYSASGTSRHGGVDVTVVVRGGKIVSAQIVSCTTRYPCSYIETLPADVVTNQRVTTHYISGATDSSRAYMQAVSAALAQAA